MIIVIAEHDGTTLKPATLSTLTAAQQLGGPVDLAILGDQVDTVCQAAKNIPGVRTVLSYVHSYFKNPVAEDICAGIKDSLAGYQYILAPATTFGKNFMPRLAAMLGVGQISDIIAVVSPDTFVRPIYAGNALETVQSLESIKVITVRPTAFEKIATTGGNASIETKPVGTMPNLSQFQDIQESKSARPDLAAARVVISGGRGLQSAENFKLLEKLADQLNAAIGASRAAVDAGFAPNDYQVGQTGKVVAPELYIAVGISGAIQHLAGMKDSKVIVAINKDGDAPIFQIADYGLVGDLFDILPELTASLAVESKAS